MHEPSKTIGHNSEPEYPRVHNPVVKSNTQTILHPSLLSLKRKLKYFVEREGFSAFSVLTKDAYVINPTALPPSKYRCIETKEPASPFVSTQQDIKLRRAQEQSLDSSSQHGESTEIRSSIRAFC